MAAAAREFVAAFPQSGGTALWREPLLAAVAADDPGFGRLRGVAAWDHLLPADLLPRARTVVVWFIPFRPEIARSNARPGAASAEWAEAYVATNRLIAGLGGQLAAWLAARGFRAATVPATHNFDPDTLMSRWSHRHIAALAGLGGFGLNNMLITPAGCSGRLGSLVCDLPPDPAWQGRGPGAEACLHKLDGSCGQCRRRCPAGALGEGGFDRFACYRVCLDNAARHECLGLADVCGKCLAGLPCTHADPAAARRLVAARK